MKRTLKCALSAVMAVAMVAPVLAQDQFPDVPANHWAFEALLRLKKDGILVGYPDGLFRGGRPVSRYELAAAVHAAYVNLKNQENGLSTQIDALNAKLDSGSGGVTKADLDALQSSLSATQTQVDSMKGWGQDISDLKKMMSEFQKELQAMGVDVESAKKGLDDLTSRVAALEKRKLPVNIHGEFDTLMLGGYSTSGTFGLTVDARPTGEGKGSYLGDPVGITRDLSIFHEGSVTLSSNTDTGPKWHGTLVMGNMLGGYTRFLRPSGAAFPTQSDIGAGSSFTEANEDIYIQDGVVDWTPSILGQHIDITGGRIGKKISPLIFQRPDVTPYYANDRWDNGNWYFDGADFGFKAGPARFDLFGGRDNPAEGGTVFGNAIAPMNAGSWGIPFTPGNSRPFGFNSGRNIFVNQHMGVDLNVGLGASGNLNLAYLWLKSNNIVNSGVGPDPNGKANGVNVYGGSLDFNVAGFKLNGEYAKSNVVFLNHANVDTQNDAYIASLSRDWDRFGAKIGYKQINPQFGAPGDWGRIGIWWNPTDVKGYTAAAHFDVSNKTRLSADAQVMSGTGNTVDLGGNISSGLGTNDHVTSLVVDLTHKLSEQNAVSLGLEDVMWDLKDRSSISFTGGKPTERWYNIGFNHKISGSSTFNVLWQISDYDSKNVQGFSLFGGSTQKGGLLTTQLSIKY